MPTENTFPIIVKPGMEPIIIYVTEEDCNAQVVVEKESDSEE